MFVPVWSNVGLSSPVITSDRFEREFDRRERLGYLLRFDFTGVQLWSFSQFMEKTEFRTKAMRAAKERLDVEKEKSKKSNTDVIASAVMGDMFSPHVN